MVDDAIFAALEATWPPASKITVSGFEIGVGAGGGKRVSAAKLLDENFTPSDVSLAMQTMEEAGQSPLFMVKSGQKQLDQELSQIGYDRVDPTLFLACPVEKLRAFDAKGYSAIRVSTPVAVMEEIWADGGVGPHRLAVMERAKVPKTYLLGRLGDRPAAAAFVGVHGTLAMVHALEVLPIARGQGVATSMMGAAASWASEQGAKDIVVAVTQANTAAIALYEKLGMTKVGAYHYRLNSQA